MTFYGGLPTAELTTTGASKQRQRSTRLAWQTTAP